MNLHLGQDEKFIDFVISDVDRLGFLNENDFVIYSETDAALKYVKNLCVTHLVVGSHQWEDFFSKKIAGYSRIYIHYFDDRLFSVITRLPKEIKVIWLFFGLDGFLLFSSAYFLQPLTKKSLRRKEHLDSVSRLGFIYYLFFPLILIRRKRFELRRARLLSNAFRRVDYFGHFIPQDFELIRNASRATFQYLPFTFNALEHLEYSEGVEPVGPNILIGNSATRTNNHLDVITRLAATSIGDRLVYSPLSYGEASYSEEIEIAGNKYFGSNFIPLKNFLPLVEYRKIVHSCGFVFMNQDRSQASDNILISLSSGAKVFMSERSTLYQFLRQMGVILFTVQHDLNSNDVFVPLSSDAIRGNRRLIRDFFGRAMHEKRLVAALNL